MNPSALSRTRIDLLGLGSAHERDGHIIDQSGLSQPGSGKNHELLIVLRGEREIYCPPDTEVLGFEPCSTQSCKALRLNSLVVYRPFRSRFAALLSACCKTGARRRSSSVR
jgi:hypothetical protein